MTSQLPSTIHVLQFELPGINACIDLHHIVKVFLLPTLEPVPNSPAYMVGMMNCAGQSIPVIDLAMRLNIARNKKYGLETPILLCEVDSKKIGLVVDKVIKLSRIEQSEIQVNDQFNDPSSAFSGVLVFESRLTYFINLKNVFSDSNKLIAPDMEFSS